ncbi:MAG: YdeI/OmpD-associated family protein [Chloroflexi bacterium]|nr:YdeI/OmpD-associated family protein [Chloroflexota bacterium]
MKLAKKNSELVSITYAEALQVALCYGWIDGQKKGFDESAWLQKFTPRGAKSIWSKINREKADMLIQSGRMKPAGLKAIQAAKQDGRWDAAYSSSRNATIPNDFQSELDEHSNAKSFFETLDRANRYAILFRLETAKKAETRAKQIQQFIRMLEKHEKIHP